MGRALFIANLTAGLEDLPALLTRAGHQVEVTTDPRHGLAMVQQRTPDMVLCDVTSPGIDGYRVLSEIRSLPDSLAVLPVLLIAERCDDDSRSRDIGLGADDVVPRSMGPVRMAAIADARLRRGAELRHVLQRCVPADCSARYHAEMSPLNDIDPIPGLLSLAQLDGLASCQTLWEPARPPVVMVIDIDRFAAINATLGNAFGDELVRAVAQRLMTFETELGLLAHLGGDTFAALLPPRTGLSEAELAGEAVRRAMVRPFTVFGRPLFATVSVGLARGEGAGGLDVLLARAIAAAHHANALGGNLVFTFQPEQMAREAERLSVAAALRTALDAGEFHMVYQPHVRLDDGRVVGAEALMRWPSRALGPVPPGVFVPVAEECGLIAELGAFAFRSAAEALRQWRAHDWGRGLVMAVNVSAHQLRRRAFPEELAAVLAATGLAASDFVLEITESTFIGQGAEMGDAIAALRDMGFRLSMDDFGTGYSSLSYLHRIPLGQLKIDQSFVRGLPHASVACGIVEAIIAIAARLNLDVVAEGVETEGQAAFLAARGVVLAQGFLLAPPLSDADFRAFCLRAPQLPAPARTAF